MSQSNFPKDVKYCRKNNQTWLQPRCNSQGSSVCVIVRSEINPKKMVPCVCLVLRLKEQSFFSANSVSILIEAIQVGSLVRECRYFPPFRTKVIITKVSAAAPNAASKYTRRTKCIWHFGSKQQHINQTYKRTASFHAQTLCIGQMSHQMSHMP